MSHQRRENDGGQERKKRLPGGLTESEYDLEMAHQFLAPQPSIAAVQQPGCCGGNGDSWLCALAETIGPPFGCVLDVVNQAVGCTGQINRQALKQAWGTFKAESGIPSVAAGEVLSKVSSGAQKFGGGLIFFTYFPLFIIGLFVIWGLVGLHLMRWGVGFLLTVLLFFFLYLMTIAFRAAIQSFIVNSVAWIKNWFIRHQDQGFALAEKAPGAVLSGICSYTGCNWNPSDTCKKN